MPCWRLVCPLLTLRMAPVAGELHDLGECPEPWWYVYGGYWRNVGQSIYHQYMVEPVPEKDAQVWVLEWQVALTECLHYQQQPFDYVQVHRSCVCRLKGAASEPRGR